MPDTQQTTSTIEHHLQLPLQELTLNAETLRATLREAAAWGEDLAREYPAPALSLHIPLVLDPMLEDQACLDIEAARGVLAAAAEERYVAIWDELFAHTLISAIDGALAAAFTMLAVGRSSAGADLAEVVADDMLPDLVADVASKGLPVPGGNAVLAKANHAAKTSIHGHSAPDSASGMSEWIVNADRGGLRQWWIEAESHVVKLGTRRCGSRERVQVAEIRSDEIPLLISLLELTLRQGESNSVGSRAPRSSTLRVAGASPTD